MSTNPPISDIEKLILIMLSEIYEKLGIRGEIDPEFVKSMVFGGHNWALHWQYSGLLHDHVDDESNVEEVSNMMDMWDCVEQSYKKFNFDDKAKVQKETELSNFEFKGFDGNNESEHMGIAQVLVNDLNRWTHWKGRDFNSHAPSLAGYRRMLAVFNRIRPLLSGWRLTADQFIEVLNARRHH